MPKVCYNSVMENKNRSTNMKIAECIAGRLVALRSKLSGVMTDCQIAHLEELSVSNIADAEVQAEVRKLLAL